MSAVASESRSRAAWAPASLLRFERRVDVPTRWLLLLGGAWLVWRRGGSAEFWWAVAAYAAVTLLTTFYWFAIRSFDGKGANPGRGAPWIGAASFLADGLFVCVLIWLDGGPTSQLYILLMLVALKAVAMAPAVPSMVWLPFAFGPMYAATLWLASGDLAFLADTGFQIRFLLLWLWLLGAALLGLELARRTSAAERLNVALGEQRAALAQKTEMLQRTATDLGARVLELRALQEVAKALAATLNTEDALQVVVQRLHDMTGCRSCAVGLLEQPAAGAPHDGGRLFGSVLVADAGAPHPFRVQLAEEPPTLALAAGAGAMGQVRAGDPQTPLRRLLGGGSYVSTPLISRGRPIGALYLSADGAALQRADGAGGLPVTEQLVTSFAYFAATAIENARLYEDAWEKRRELEAVLAGIGDAVLVVDTGLALVLVNPVAQRIMGVERELPAGVPLRPYLPSEAFARLFDDTLQTGEEQARELDLPGPNDRPAASETGRTFGAVASPVINYDGEVSGVVAVLRDITAQKELERMKSNFLSVVSHELRTPLHSIKGFVEIILMGKTGPVTELQEDFLRTVRTQTTGLQRMIDDLLEFSRMEAGRVRLHLAEVPLASVVQAVAAKLAPLADEQNLLLYLDFPDDLPLIDGDRVRLEQVVTNLVENAIKFTPSGGEVVIAAAIAGEWMRLTVSDTGIGIAPGEQERVFDRFYQVDGSETRAYRGAGLGLSICKHIVERHGGRIWVESEGIPGLGSRFHVDLPLELRPQEAPIIDFTTRTG